MMVAFQNVSCTYLFISFFLLPHDGSHGNINARFAKFLFILAFAAVLATIVLWENSSLYNCCITKGTRVHESNTNVCLIVSQECFNT